MDEYTEEFYLRQARNDLSEDEEQSVARYVVGLHYPIQDQVILHDLARIDEVYRLALKVESQLNRSSTRRVDMVQSGSSSAGGTQAGAKMPSDAQNVAPFHSIKVNLCQFDRSKGILGSKPSTFNCFKCGQLGHKSSVS